MLSLVLELGISFEVACKEIEIVHKSSIVKHLCHLTLIIDEYMVAGAYILCHYGCPLFRFEPKLKKRLIGLKYGIAVCIKSGNTAKGCQLQNITNDCDHNKNKNNNNNKLYL